MVKVPEDWKTLPLGKIGTFTKGAPLSKSHISENGTPLVLYGELYTTYKEVAYEIYRRTKSEVDEQYYSCIGDIIIPTSGETAEDIARACCIMVPGVILAGDLNIFRCKGFDGRFISYVINHVINRQISEVAQGISIIHVNAKELKKISINYPELDEQENISDTLDCFNKHIENLEKLISKKEGILKASLADLMSGHTRIAGYDGKWVNIPLSECGKFVSGNGFPVKYQGKKKGDLPFYKVSDLSGEGNDTHMKKANNYISYDVASTLSCNVIPANSVVFAKIGAAIFLERKRLTTIDCCIDNNMMALQVYDKYSPRFIWRVLQRIVLGEYAQTTALPSLSGKTLGEIDVYIPEDVEEQNSIADVIESMEKEILDLKEEKNKIIQIREGAMDDLLIGRVRLTK